MRIRNRRLIRGLAWLVAGASRLLFRTMRLEMRMPQPECTPYHPHSNGKYLICLWHDGILGIIFSKKTHQIAALTSRHADGAYVSEALDAIGVPTVRGSSGRGGAEALRQMMVVAEKLHIAIATDGPRGPRRVVKEGIVYLASQTGRGIIPAAFAARWAWRPRGRWTDLVVPLPFSKTSINLGDAIFVPPGLSRDELEPYRLRVQQAMDALHAVAEARASGRRGADNAMAVHAAMRRKAA